MLVRKKHDHPDTLFSSAQEELGNLKRIWKLDDDDADASQKRHICLGAKKRGALNSVRQHTMNYMKLLGVPTLPKFSTVTTLCIEMSGHTLNWT